jgi:ABC-type glutathione transport system ATPase component
MSVETLLEVRDLHVEIADRAVLSGVSFAIAPGSIVGLCGESGCGKTTLALALVNLLTCPPYRVRGEVLTRARIGFVFQDSLLALNPVLRIRTQLHEIVRVHGAEQDLAQLLALAGLTDADRILRAYPHQLSGGERQRVTIAQALACRPELIIADEPFTALDAPRVVELAALFRDLRDRTGTSLLVISHAPGVLAALADEVLRLSEGRIVERGAPQEVLRRDR